MARLEGLLMVLIVSGIAVAFVSAFGVNLILGNPPATTVPSSQSTRSFPVTTSTTISTFSTTTVTSTVPTTGSGQGYGSLSAKFTVGPMQPVCYAYESQGPAPLYFSSIEAAVTDSDGRVVTYAVNWISNGCYVTGTFSTSLPTGEYSINLSSCTWMGASRPCPGTSQSIRGSLRMLTFRSSRA